MASGPKTLATKCREHLFNVLNFIVFLFLDLLEAILCVVYKCLDKCLEGKSSPCYCVNKGSNSSSTITGRDGACQDDLSESLYGRSNTFSKMGSFSFSKKSNDGCSIGSETSNQVNNTRWSDCNCETCTSWTKYGSERLHVVVKEPSASENIEKQPEENVIFIHGFLCSSSFWTESVFKNLSEKGKQNYRLFAIDLLGFGKSPKPVDCLYTIRDHIEMIEKSVIKPYGLKSFHLVAHSMGCPIALALAAKYSNSIKSATFVAPACFPCGKDEDGVDVLKKLAKKTIYPFGTFHTSVMAWYEHLGRSLCFLICRYHITWEKLIKLLTRKRDLSFAIKDITKHTHHSAWHNVHNVICGGAKQVDGYLQILKKSDVRLSVVHGQRDTTIPVECACNFKTKVPNAELHIIPHANHSSIILRRKKEFTHNLELFWASSTSKENTSL